MAESLGIKKIEMYIEMVNNEFDPLLEKVNNVSRSIREQIEQQAKIELGVYDLLVRETQLEDELHSVQSQLNDVRQKSYRNGRYQSLLDSLVDQKMQDQFPMLQEIQSHKESIVRKIKLAGIGKEIADVFEDIDGVILNLNSQIDAAALSSATSAEMIEE